MPSKDHPAEPIARPRPIRSITEVFLSATFGDGRHARRVEMIKELEKTRGKKHGKPPTV